MNPQTNAEYSRDQMEVLQLLQKYPSLNLKPLIELVTEDEGPEYLESFCNELIHLIAQLYREEDAGILPKHIMQTIQQLHQLREVFRKLRSAPSWP